MEHTNPQHQGRFSNTFMKEPDIHIMGITETRWTGDDIEPSPHSRNCTRGDKKQTPLPSIRFRVWQNYRVLQLNHLAVFLQKLIFHKFDLIEISIFVVPLRDFLSNSFLDVFSSRKQSLSPLDDSASGIFGFTSIPFRINPKMEEFSFEI